VRQRAGVLLTAAVTLLCVGFLPSVCLAQERIKPDVAKEMRRDGAVEADDSITIVPDTYLDHRNAF
jgi:hypothetical protein